MTHWPRSRRPRSRPAPLDDLEQFLFTCSEEQVTRRLTAQLANSFPDNKADGRLLPIKKREGRGESCLDPGGPEHARGLAFSMLCVAPRLCAAAGSARPFSGVLASGSPRSGMPSFQPVLLAGSEPRFPAVIGLLV